MRVKYWAILVSSFALGCDGPQVPQVQSTAATEGDAGAEAGSAGFAGSGGGNDAAGGSGGAGAVDQPRQLTPSAPLELPLLSAEDPLLPFQHSAEVTVAAHDGTVVFAFINLHHDAADTLLASNLRRRVGVAVSRDGGKTIEPSIELAPISAETSDPVVRVSSDGVFWLAALGVENDVRRGLLWRSDDGAKSWQNVQSELAIYDKEWLAIASDGSLYLGALGGFWRFERDGTIGASWLIDPDWPVSGAFADAQGAYFAVVGGYATNIARWNGEQSATSVGSIQHNYSTWNTPIGRSATGEIWAVAATRSVDMEQSSVNVRLFDEGSDESRDVPLSDAAANAFLPAGSMDAEGRLHVIWYESSATTGVLKYARSVSADLEAGFEPARVVDDRACPAGLWYPVYANGQPGGVADRRLREYIDLAVDADRVHFAWTRAQALPARVNASYLDF